MSFTLHPQLAADTKLVCDLPLCRVLLMNNQNFPWLILVPRKDGLREIFDCPAEDYTQMMDEVRSVTAIMATHTKADKINVATLGNMVPQLHIHIIARFVQDIALAKPRLEYCRKSLYDTQALVKEKETWHILLQDI